MPTITHDILLRGIDKDVAPNGLDYSGRRVLNPVRDVLNGRYFSSEDGEVYVCEAIKGTQKVGTPPAPPTLAGLASWIGAPWTVDGVQWNSVPQVVLTALGQQYEVRTSDGRSLTPYRVEELLAEELEGIRLRVGVARFAEGSFATAARMFGYMVTSDDFDDFLTLPAYDFLP